MTNDQLEKLLFKTIDTLILTQKTIVKNQDHIIDIYKILKENNIVHK